MTYLDQFYSDVKALMTQVWGTTVGGTWEREQQDMVPWAKLEPPYSVMIASDMAVDDGEFGTGNQIYMPTVDLYYVGASAGSSSAIRGQLESMRDALLSTGVASGQVVDVTELSWGDKLEANMIFVAKDYKHRAGKVCFTALVGTVQS